MQAVPKGQNLYIPPHVKWDILYVYLYILYIYTHVHTYFCLYIYIIFNFSSFTKSLKNVRIFFSYWLFLQGITAHITAECTYILGTFLLTLTPGILANISVEFHLLFMAMHHLCIFRTKLHWTSALTFKFRKRKELKLDVYFISFTPKFRKRKELKLDVYFISFTPKNYGQHFNWMEEHSGRAWPLQCEPAGFDSFKETISRDSMAECGTYDWKGQMFPDFKSAFL